MVRLIPAPRGTGIVSAPVPKKLLHMAGIDDCYTAASGQTATLGNFGKQQFSVLTLLLFKLSCKLCCSLSNSSTKWVLEVTTTSWLLDNCTSCGTFTASPSFIMQCYSKSCYRCVVLCWQSDIYRLIVFQQLIMLPVWLYWWCDLACECVAWVSIPGLWQCTDVPILKSVLCTCQVQQVWSYYWSQQIEFSVGSTASDMC